MQLLAKCMEIKDNKMILKLPDESIVEYPANELIPGAFILNVKVDVENNRYIMNASEVDLINYNILSNSNCKKAKIIEQKAAVLGIDKLKLSHFMYSNVIISDYNRVLDGSYQFDTIQFIGGMSLILDSNKGKQFSSLICNKAIIDNPCIMSNITPIVNMNIQVIAEDYIIKHGFINLYTIDEIKEIYKMVLDDINNTEKGFRVSTVSLKHYRKILIDFKNTKYTQAEIEEHTIGMINSSKDNEIDLVASFITGVCIYDSLKCKSIKLKEVLLELDEDIGKVVRITKFASISRYYNTARVLKGNRRDWDS